MFVNTYHEHRKEWMEKFEQVLRGQNYCGLCPISDMNSQREIYYKMNVIHEGYLNLWIDGNWKKSYYAIDGKTIRMFYTENIQKMDQFQSAVIKKQHYEQYIEENMEGYYLLLGESVEIVNDEFLNAKHNQNGNVSENGNIDDYNIDSDDDGAGHNKARGTIDLGPSFQHKSTESNESKDNNLEIAQSLEITVIGQSHVYASAYMNNGVHIDESFQTNPKMKVFKRFKYKFRIGDDIFGCNKQEKMKEWIDALGRAVDFSKRELDKYDDEKTFLCTGHLELLLYGFIGGLQEFEISLNIKRQIFEFLGDECWDNTALIAF